MLDGLADVEQEFRSQIGPIRPFDGAGLGVHKNLPKHCPVAQRLENLPVEFAGEVNVFYNAIVEPESQSVLVEISSLIDIGACSPLLKGRDRFERAASAC